MMERLGLSETDDITPLDSLGVPVFVCFRSERGKRRMHAGKGLTRDEARIGAVMEAMEFAVASRFAAAGPDTTLPLADLVGTWPKGLALADLAPRLGVEAPPDRPTAAVQCENMRTGQAALLPAELVLVPFDQDGSPPLFGWTSNGLASGNSLDEATLFGLLEVLERDTMAMNMARDDASRLDVEALPQPFGAWAAAWQAKGVQLVVRALPNPFGLPCFEAVLLDASHPDIGLTRGWGFHFDRFAALSRAICEAAQTRLWAIQLSRPEMADVRAHSRPETADARHAAMQVLKAHVLRTSRTTSLEAVPNVVCKSIEAALDDLLSRMAAQDMPWVFRHRLDAQIPGGGPTDLHFVKVVVPRCECALSKGPRMGPRLLARLRVAP
jgi:ribosomal protein S12 methylthiotransferase accessory factor